MHEEQVIMMCFKNGSKPINIIVHDVEIKIILARYKLTKTFKNTDGLLNLLNDFPRRREKK